MHAFQILFGLYDPKMALHEPSTEPPRLNGHEHEHEPLTREHEHGAFRLGDAPGGARSPTIRR